MAWTRLCDVAQVPANRGLVVERPEGALAVFVVDGTPHVLENACPHRGGDLGEGYVNAKNGCVYCPLHAWPFELATGCSPTHPGASVRIFAARIQEGAVEADLVPLAAAGGAR